MLPVSRTALLSLLVASLLPVTGIAQTSAAPHALDGEAPTDHDGRPAFLINVEHVSVRVGRGFLLKVDALQPAKKVYVDAPELGFTRMALTTDTTQLRFQRFLKVAPGAVLGLHSLDVVVERLDGTQLRRRISIDVYDVEDVVTCAREARPGTTATRG